MSRIRAFAVLGVAAGMALSFASCGGGGGGTIAPPQHSPSPSPLPSGSPHPAANGDAFVFSGASTQTTSRNRPTPTPPPVVTDSSVTQSLTVQTGATFHTTSATDFHSIETDAGPHQTITTTSDNYFLFPSSPGNVVQIGFSSTDSNGVTLDVQYLAGNGIIDQLPEVSGASWTNTAAASITENDPDGTMTTQSINADGSYSETRSEIAGTTTVTENSNGTGSFTSPTTIFFGTGSGTQIAVGAQSLGSIPITISAVGAPAPTPVPIAITVAAWYSATPTLASDSTTDMGTTNMPSGCAASMFGTRGIQLHESRTRLDTILGYTETETDDTWIVPGAGPACVKISDTVNLYYDDTGQSLNISDLLSSTVVQVTSLTETVGLQSETIFGAARHPLGVRSAAALLEPRIAISRQRIERFRQAVRQRSLRTLRGILSRRILK